MPQTPIVSVQRQTDRFLCRAESDHCDDLVEWIQEATWHSGRRDVPRVVGDELSMRSDGGVTEWFDQKGRATFQTED